MLQQCFSNFNMHTNHLGISSLQILIQKVWGWGPRICIFNSFPGDKVASGPGSTFWFASFYNTWLGPGGKHLFSFSLQSLSCTLYSSRTVVLGIPWQFSDFGFLYPFCLLNNYSSFQTAQMSPSLWSLQLSHHPPWPANPSVDQVLTALC